MKKALLTLAALAMASSSFAQGIITFYNSGISRPAGYTVASPGVDNPTTGTYQAGVFRPDGTTGAGDGFTAGLFLASDLSTALATTVFRTAAGTGQTTAPQIFTSSKDVTVAGVPVNSTANFVVRVYETGKTFDTSLTRGEAAFTSQPLGGPNAGAPPTPNASMLGFNGIVLSTIPEPSTIALGIAGLGALALARRRK